MELANLVAGHLPRPLSGQWLALNVLQRQRRGRRCAPADADWLPVVSLDFLAEKFRPGAAAELLRRLRRGEVAHFSACDHAEPGREPLTTRYPNRTTSIIMDRTAAWPGGEARELRRCCADQGGVSSKLYERLVADNRVEELAECVDESDCDLIFRHLWIAKMIVKRDQVTCLRAINPFVEWPFSVEDYAREALECNAPRVFQWCLQRGLPLAGWFTQAARAGRLQIMAMCRERGGAEYYWEPPRCDRRSAARAYRRWRAEDCKSRHLAHTN